MILDTNALSGLAGGEEGLVEILSRESVHHLPVIVLGEFRYGLIRSQLRKSLESWLKNLEAKSRILPVDLNTVVHYSIVREELRKKGRPIPENDVWIAALAHQHRLSIASRDTHFDHVSGIHRLGWNL